MTADDFFSTIWKATWVLSELSIVSLIILYIRRLIIEAYSDRRERRRKIFSDQIFTYINNPSDTALLSPLGKTADQKILLSVATRLLQNVSGATRERLIGLLNDTIDITWLLRELQSGIPADRAKVAARLFWSEEPQVHDALQKALDDDEPEVVLAAAASLVATGQNIDVKRLAAIFAKRGMLSNRGAREIFRNLAKANVVDLIDLLSHSNTEIVLMAADALSRSVDADVVRILSALATTHQSKDVRAQAIRSLGLGTDQAAIEAVIACFEDEAWEVRAQAAIAAERLKMTDAIPRLIEMVRDTSWWVQMRAAEALAQLGDRGIAALERMKMEPDVAMLADVALSERHLA